MMLVECVARVVCPDCGADIPNDGCCWYCENAPGEERKRCLDVVDGALVDLVTYAPARYGPLVEFVHGMVQAILAGMVDLDLLLEEVELERGGV